ncbi:MAG: InlB B-repeat-containing protein, partial [Lachnospiraceae bacterium]|nr:InlB B-repeat-containing protein [Lachnospiraceae bacterium]
MGSLEGEIDTFKKYYHFNLELNVFDLFETKAELELMRFEKTGDLMPNKLYFFVGSEAAKIPLVPPVVVANISGAGGGFDHLAETFNGDFFAIPPINISVTGRGDVLHTIEAKATYTFGPAYYKMEAEDVGIKILKKLNLIDEFSIYEGIQGETRKYKNTTYTGLSALGGASVHASVPHKSKVFQASGEINASVFGGLDSYKSPSSVYVVADLNGDVKGSVHIPEGVDTIGGTKIASTEIAFYLGASSAIQVRNTDFEGAVKSAFNNFKVYGGLMKEDDWKVAAWRAYYIFPNNDAGFTIKPFWKELPEWNWDDHKPSSYSAYATEDEGALALVSVSMEPLAASVKENEEKNASVAQSSDYSKTVTLQANEGQTLPSDATVLLMATPADGTDINAFAESLTVSKGNQTIALTWPKYNENDEIINESEINAMVTTNAKGKDCVMIGLGENASVEDEWTVTSNLADFNASLNASMPFDSLNMELNGYDLSGKVENADTGAKYVLATYFGNKQGEMEYLIENTEITDSDNISVTIPTEGTMLPTGDYYVTTSLLRKATIEVEDEEGNSSPEEVLLPVDTKEFGAVSYTNTAQPDAPTTAVIKPIGNEIMNASWSEVANADGYKVTIYQNNDGEYEDTGRGYSYDAADIEAGKISGISYDSDNKKFSLDMSLTVAGEDIGETGESKGGTTALEAGKNYKIGVQAYKYLTEGEEKIENSQVYSTETLSNDSDLPAYTPIDINVVLNTLKGSGASSKFVEQTITEEDSVLSCVASGGDNNIWYLKSSVEGETNANATFTVTRIDTGKEYTANTTGECSIDNTDIIGSVMFKIDAEVDKGSYTDTTTKYLLVQKDDTAPVFSLDDTVVYADPNTGEYTITGMTEPNMKVCLNEEDYYGNPIEAATADETGRFSYNGKLELTKEIPVYDEEGQIQVDENEEPIMETVPNESSALVSLLAEDENGNRSAVESAVITVKEINAVTLITNGGTIKDGKNVTSYFDGKEVSLPTENDITYEGHKFKGWYDNEALTGSPVTKISSTDTGDKVFYAKWEHTYNGKATTTKATANSNGKIVKTCAVCNKAYETTVIPKVSAIKFQPTDYTYNGRANMPKVQVVDAAGKTIPSRHYTVSFASGRKNVGSYKVTVTFRSSSDKYSGTVDEYFKINPKGTSISKVSRAKKAFTVKWKKQSKKMAKLKIKGYQIRYSTSSKMT